MNISFPIVFIPEGLRWLLDVHLNNSKKSYTIIMEEILNDHFLKIHIHKVFKKYIRNNSIDSFINTIGWKGFRDRLAATYLFHFEHGYFPDEEVNTGIDELLKFENQLSGMFPEGSNRIFVLGIFFKLCEIASKKDHEQNWESHLDLSDFLISQIQKGEQKITKPDWLVFCMIHFEKYINKDKFQEIVNKGKGNFYLFLKELDEKQKEILMTNLLRYGASINEEEMFLFEKV